MIQRPLARCFLRQARGTKRLLLFPPSATADLYAYPPNHPLHRRSRVDLYAPRAVTAARFPRFVSRALPTALDATLEEGDVLFLPPGWWHHIETCSTLSFSIGCRYV